MSEATRQADQLIDRAMERLTEVGLHGVWSSRYIDIQGPVLALRYSAPARAEEELATFVQQGLRVEWAEYGGVRDLTTNADE